MAFQPGQSGNPNGRPRGCRNKVTRLRHKLDAGELIELALSKARDGDVQALKLLLDRVLPALRAESRAVKLDLPAGSLSDQGRAVLTAVGGARLPPDTGAALLTALANQARLVETTELAERVKALEEKTR